MKTIDRRSFDVDEIVVERLLTGQPIHHRITAGELQAAVAELARRGLSSHAIAHRLSGSVGLSFRTVERHLAGTRSGRIHFEESA